MFLVAHGWLIHFAESVFLLVFLCFCLDAWGKRKWLPLLACVPVGYLLYLISRSFLPFHTRLLLNLALDVLTATVLFRGKIWDRILCGCASAMISTAIRIFLMLPTALFFGIPAHPSPVVPVSPGLFWLINPIGYLITCGTFYGYMIRSRKVFIGLPTRETILLIVYLLVCVMQGALAQHTGMNPNLPDHFGGFLNHLLTSCFCFTSLIVWMQLVSRLCARTYLLEMEKQHLADERARLDDMQSSYLALRTWRHDYRNHISLIQYYAEQEEWHALREYLGELNEQLPMSPMPVCSENPVFNALIHTKTLLASQAGVNIQVEANLPESLPMDDVTFCALLGNLLDNALEAAKRLPAESKPWIRLSAQLNAEVFVLRVVNSTDGTYLFSRDRLLSRKAEPNHGIGLMRVEQIARSLHGKLTLIPKRETFEAYVHIPCSTRKEA